MKKLIMTLWLILILSACQPTQDVITMIVPSGSPELAQLFMQNQGLYQVDIVQGADPLIAAFGAKSHDVIFAPTNLGAKMYSANPSYVLLGVVVWGNLYLVSNTGLDDLTDLNQKEITVFGQNQTSDIILRHILLEQNIQAELTYVDSVATATSLFLADPSRIVLTAEPSFSKIQSIASPLKWISLQEAYGNIHGTTSYPQAGIFIKRDLDHQTRVQIEDDIIESVERVIEQKEIAAELAIRLGSTLDKNIIIQAISNSNIRYQSANQAKEAVITYFEMIMQFNHHLIGTMPPSDFYGGQV
jgi:NitT/TauT family transport system substrate-binding protein